MALQMFATTRLNQGIRLFFSEFVRVSWKRPAQTLLFARTFLWKTAAPAWRGRE